MTPITHIHIIWSRANKQTKINKLMQIYNFTWPLRFKHTEKEEE